MVNENRLKREQLITYLHKLWMWLTLSTKPNLILAYLCSWIHIEWIQVDWYMRRYLQRWRSLLQNYKLHCLLHTRRYLRHHRAIWN